MAIPVDALVTDYTIYAPWLVAGIVLTGFALWTDYFGRHVDRLAEETPDFDRIAELQRLKGMGLLAFILQALVYLSGGPVRIQHPVISLFLFAGALLAQGQIQLGGERKVRRHQTAQGPHVGLAFRSLAVMLLSTLGYFALVYGTSLGFFLIASLLKAPTWAQGTAGLVGAGAGIFAGLALSFAFAPTTMRRMVPVSPLDEPETRALLDRCFDRAEVARPSYWVIEVESFRANNALIAGFSSGKGWFRPALFITRPLLKECPPAELEAIILHEVSHLALNHLRKRFLFSFGVVMAAVFATAALLVTAQLLLPLPSAQWTTLVCAIFAFIVPFIAIKNQGHRQELEADAFAVLRLGAPLESIAGALRRIDRMNAKEAGPHGSASLLVPDAGHPATEQRIIQVRQAVEFERALATAQAAADIDEKRAA